MKSLNHWYWVLMIKFKGGILMSLNKAPKKTMYFIGIKIGIIPK